jgi:hypothetical protein
MTKINKALLLIVLIILLFTPLKVLGAASWTIESLWNDLLDIIDKF